MRGGPFAVAVLLALAGCAAPRPAPAPVHPPPAQALPASETSSASVRGIAAAAIAGGDAAAATVALDHLAAMGATVSPGGQSSYADLLGAAAKLRLADRFAANAVPIRASQLETTISAASPLVEGLAYDARTGRLFAGTVIDGQLLSRRGGGEWRPVWIGRPTGGLFGMAVDARRRLLWIAVAEVEQVRTPGERTAGLIAVNLDRLRVTRRIPLPSALAGSLPGDVAIASDGTVYASDPARGRVLVCRPGCTALAELVPEDVLGSAQGLVLTPDESALIVADYGDGLHRVDLATGRVEPVTTAEPAMLDGIDGLIADGATLLAIQNGTSPRRILRLTLDESASRIVSSEILERDNPDWGEPTLGTIVGDRLFYVADGQWERYGPNGAIMDDAPPHGTPIRSIALPRE